MTPKSNTNVKNTIKFNNRDMKSADSALMYNPFAMMVKFILTDDLPNGNRHRIPKEEFPNILKTGVYMPVKMVDGEIGGHENAKPIGVITHLMEETLDDGTNRILALAALWGLERPEDVEYIKNQMETVGEVNVSWEVSFANQVIEDGGVIALQDVVLNGVSIVKNPAYQGRTRFLAIAAKAEMWSPAYIENLPDESFLYVGEGGKRYFAVKDATGLVSESRLLEAAKELEKSEFPEEIKGSVRTKINQYLSELYGGLYNETPDVEEKLENKNLSELEGKLTSLESTLSEKQQLVESLQAKVEELEAEKSSMLAEITTLKEFKASIEEKEEKARKLAEIKAKFAEAGIQKDDSYFEENGEKLLKMSPEQLEFIIQEFIQFKSTQASLNEVKPKIPNLTEEVKQLSPKELAKLLREYKK
jgi:hypothetical protein